MEFYIFFFLLFCLFVSPAFAFARVAVWFGRGVESKPYPDKNAVQSYWTVSDILTFIVLPTAFYLMIDGGRFGPTGLDFAATTMLVFIGCVVIAYFTFAFYRSLFPPGMELVLNLIVGAGGGINAWMIYDAGNDGPGLWFTLAGHLPVMGLCVIMILRRHRLLMIQTGDDLRLHPQHSDVLDYIPVSRTDRSYEIAARAKGITRLLLLEAWQKVVFFTLIGGGIVLVVITGLETVL